jgi:hypothetical protein
MNRIRLPLLSCFVATALAGCGASGPRREHVLGEVTLNGQSLPTGRIRFIPADDGKIQASAGIQQGKFELPTDEGLPAGDYRVEIEGDVDLGFAVDDDVAFSKRDRKKPLAAPPVPPEYNRNSNLTVTVIPGRSNPLEFPLTYRNAQSK